MNTEIILGLFGLFGTLSGYFFGIRRNKADAESVQIDNMAKITDAWKKLSEDLEKRLTAEINTLRTENMELKALVGKLSDENAELRKKMKSLDSENRKLLDELKRFNERNPTA